MEILVTIIAFWLILVGAYGAYSLTQERSRERAPRVRPQRQVNLTPAAASGSGPFGRPVSLPVEKVPTFINRGSRAVPEPQVYDDIEEQLIDAVEEEDVPERFRAERIVAARVQQSRASTEEPTAYQEPARYEEPLRYAEPVRHEEPRREEPRRRPARPMEASEIPNFELPSRPGSSEVEFLRAEVQHLRSEINALSSEAPRKDRPQQRRYRTGNYTHLPRTLRRQVNEARGRFFNS